MDVYGTKREGSDYFIQVAGPMMDGRHDNIRRLEWQPADVDQASAALLAAQLAGVEGHTERTGEKQWQALFTRAVQITDPEELGNNGEPLATSEWQPGDDGLAKREEQLAQFRNPYNLRVELARMGRNRTSGTVTSQPRQYKPGEPF